LVWENEISFDYKFVGTGINITNEEPTTCLLSAIKKFNENSQTKISLPSREELFALFLNKFEKYYEDLCNGGVDALLHIYLKWWLHRFLIIIWFL
jgi:biotin-(acetyl-CoA carboxylase) ligase